MDADKCCFRFYCLTEWKAGNSAKNIHQRLEDVWGEASPGYSTIKRWLQNFKEEDLPSLHDKPKSGRPRSSLTTDNINTIQTLINDDPRLSIRSLELTTGISHETIRKILTDELQLKKVCSAWVPHQLSANNKELRVNCAKHIRHVLTELGDDAVHFFAVEDESWFFFQPCGSKQSNMAWLPKHGGIDRPQITRPSTMTVKKTLVLFVFTCDKKLNVQALEYGTMIDSDVYIQFCHQTGEKWRVLRQNPTTLKSLKWQHDNAKAHSSKATKEFFERRHVPLVFQSPYSPDFNICDRWLFKELKRHLGTQIYNSSSEIADAIKNAFKSIPEDKFKKQIHMLFDYCQAVIDRNGDYVSDMY